MANPYIHNTSAAPFELRQLNWPAVLLQHPHLPVRVVVEHFVGHCSEKSAHFVSATQTLILLSLT